MKFSPPQTLASIADIIGAKPIGPDDFPILGLNEIHVVESGDIVFVDHPKYYDKALNSNATIILINKNVPCPDGKALLVSEDPFNDTLKLIDHFSPFQSSKEDISESAKIGKNTIIQPGAFIGNNVTIGDNCLIHSNVSIYDNAVIGNNVVIHANTVLGGDAFYYQKREGNFKQFTSCGRVVIHDHVHIGANCTIDRGVTGDTTIGEGTKLDNLIHVGHDTVIGKNCLFASQVGIAGCVIIKDNVTLWGQVGVASDLTINDDVVVFAQSGVGKDLKEGKSYFGSPCEESRSKYREMYTLKKMAQNQK
ncbi:MAG: UDP-3-O-(3-hydroxymyristoyl)glucosamine N-acyltransferase [Crocinitomicaceae bacterium]|nr:UDP-3-O-(3-hydroxymyristoyl)glucosamine N-acyltransferase [Crocinitomicaceae bacterium]|tara:strand:+ start:20168 stop:21088 length:921 start_codon:yes stop_codon:yes gene_type:complete